MDAKIAARKQVEVHNASLIALSHRIHANPETAFMEVKASEWIAEELASADFTVQKGICGLQTAFLAQRGSGPLHIAICAEYDSLPGIGHACGHNIIAAMAVGAGIAAAKVADEVGLTITVIGTPAEEAGNAGGKIQLLEEGAFTGVHAAMMVHPGPLDILTPHMIAASIFTAEFVGKEAHASAFPELGINAADAMTIAQVGIGLLRQHIRLTDRVHGIVTKGGDAPNVIPAYTTSKYLIRSDTLEDLKSLSQKVRHCFEAGAVATGAKLIVNGGDRPYAQVIHDVEIASLYQRNAEALGRCFSDEPFVASTDMGNVSLTIPTIHPIIGINSFPAVNHQPEFTAHCITKDADKALIDGAIAMAWTAIDMANNSTIYNRLIAHP